MGIKEKELEDLVLNLLDTSPAIQRKIRNLCSAVQDSTAMSNTNITQSDDAKPGLFDKRKISSLEANIEQLNGKLALCQNEYRQAVSRLQECENHFSQLQSKCRSLEADKSNLECKVSHLEDDLKKAKDELEANEHRSGVLERENSSLTSKLEVANEKIRSLEERFSEPIAMLARYRSLPASIRTGLSDVICDKDEVLFIVSCSDPDNLKAIWNYTKRLTGSSGDTYTVEVLKDIFDRFFEVFNSSLREPMYARDNVEAGYSFDDDKYDRFPGSSTSGKITQVILRGYSSVNTGAIICRSLVRV